MYSPVENSLKNIIKLYKNNSGAIYLQIAQQLINAIQGGHFTNGTVLPGTRSLSKLLKIHRNTVVAAYEELASQGWVEIVANKGTFVLKPISQKSNYSINSTQLKNTGFKFYTNAHLTPPYEKISTHYTFNDGQTDIRLHIATKYNRWYNAAVKKSSIIKKWNNFSSEQSSFLNTQVCNYVNSTRKFHVSPKNILCTQGNEMNLYLVAQLLLKPKDVVLVGDVSNFSANMIFNQAKATIKVIPVDEEGLDVDFIRKNFTKRTIRCVYCTPRRHYPTTFTLSDERRLKLLQLATEYGFAIIEDDFDFDFDFDGKHIPTLANMDVTGNVIYLGKVGQAVFPAFELGIIVAPENFIKEVRNYYRMLYPHSDIIKEQILGTIIYEGELQRQLKKKILAYKERRDTMCNALNENFGHLINYTKPNGGLAVFIRFVKPINLVKLTKLTLKYDLTIPKYLLYQTKSLCGIRIGYGHLNIDEIDDTIKILKKAYIEIDQIDHSSH